MADIVEVLLHGFVRSVGVSDDDAVTACDDIVEPLLHLGGKPGNVSRAAYEDGVQWLLRVLVMVRARTAAALPGPSSSSVIAFMVVDRNYSRSVPVCQPKIDWESSAIPFAFRRRVPIRAAGICTLRPTFMLQLSSCEDRGVPGSRVVELSCLASSKKFSLL
jgi:hypothetical protein